MRVRLWIAAGALLGLALAGWWQLGGREASALPRVAGPAASWPAPLASPAEPGSAPMTPKAARVSVAQAASAASANGTASLSPRALRMRADWCGYGAAESEKDEQQHPESSREQLEQTDGMRVLRAAQREARARWVRQLRKRGDLRSVALADFLDVAFFALPREDAGSRARLQDLARRSTDPLLTALALRRPCAPDECTNIEATQWSRLEPDNILAWVAQLDTLAMSRQRQAELIAQIAAQATHGESHDGEIVTMLLTLPVEHEPGLAYHAEAMLLHEFNAAGGPDLLSLALACRDADALPATRQHCLHIADRLWQQEDAYKRWLAVAIGQILDRGNEQWISRHLLHAAVSRAHREHEAQELEALGSIPAKALCPSLPRLRNWEFRRLSTSEWQQGLDLMKASGLEPRAWLTRWHDAHPTEPRPQYLGPAPAASR